MDFLKLLALYILDHPFIFTTLFTTSVAVALAIGGWIVAYFIAIKKIEKTLVKQLQIEASREVIKSLRNFCDKFNALDVFLTKTKINLESHINDSIIRLHVLLSQELEEFLDLRKKSSEALIALVFLFEDNEVILNKFTNFNREIFNGYEKLRTLSRPYEDWFRSKFSPILSEEEFKKLKELTEKFLEFTLDMISYADDYIRELQNCYQSDLFGYKISKREPKDKKFKVLSLDK